jgi:Tol biopolymer transport system component
MDADGGNATVILPYAGNSTSLEPSWSPDGMYIVFNGTIAGPGIYVVNVDGSGLTLLKPGATTAYLGAPVWSPVPAPDGHYKILFVEEVPYVGGGSSVGDTTVEVMVINLDGTGYQQLTDDPYDFPFDVSWSPSATRFATASVGLEAIPFIGDCSVYDLSLVDGVLSASSGTSVVQLPGSPLENVEAVGWVDWANGSDTLAVAANPNGWGVWIVELANPASPLELGGNASERQPTWSPDDTQVVYWRTGPGKDGIFTMDSFGTGDPILLRSSGKAPDWRP